MLNYLFGCFAVDELEEESSIQCTEPQHLTPESMRTEKLLENDENVVDIDHSAQEMILREAIQHRGHTVANQGGNISICITKYITNMLTVLNIYVT